MLVTERSTADTPVICPVCGTNTDRAEYRYSDAGATSFIFRCAGCDLLFLRPLALANLTDRQMDCVDYVEYVPALFKFLHENLILRKEINEVKKVGASSRLLLDIGCGTGWTTAFWKSKGFEVTGVEPSQARAALARKRHGMEVIESYLEDLKLDKSYDVIILRHMVEHLADPLPMLEKVVGHLAPDGILLIVVPNIDSIGRRLFDNLWEWVLPLHCSFFNPRSLRALVEAAGLCAEKLYQSPSPLYYSECLTRKYPGSALARRINGSSLGSALFSLPLAGAGWLSGQGDNLTIIARRRRK